MNDFEGKISVEYQDRSSNNAIAKEQQQQQQQQQQQRQQQQQPVPVSNKEVTDNRPYLISRTQPESNNNSPNANDVFFSPDFDQITVNDLISVVPDDWKFMTSLAEQPNLNYLYSETKYPNLQLFKIIWDAGPLSLFVGTVEQNDPTRANANVELSDDHLIDFVWTIVKVTRYFYHFVMYPDEFLLDLLDFCFKLGTVNPIIQSVMTYDCSLHIMRIYKESGKMELYDSWDQQIRIPAFKECIDILKDRLEKCDSFSEMVGLSFAVVIIFSGTSSDKSWRSHLSGTYQLLLKASKLRQNAKSDDSFDYAALKLFDIVCEWFRHLDFLVQVCSFNGADKRKLKIENNRNLSDNIAVSPNGINMMTGHCVELIEIKHRVFYFIEDFRKKGINLSGIHLIRISIEDDVIDSNGADLPYPSSSSPPSQSQSHHTMTRNDRLALKVEGYESLSLLESLSHRRNVDRLPIKDLKMNLTINFCNKVYFLAFELYLKYFYVGLRNLEEINQLILKIIDTIHSMPNQTSVALICHWCIFLTGEVAILIGNEDVYKAILGILGNFVQNGMDVNSREILQQIKTIVYKGQGLQLGKSLLVDDFVIF
ncbi:hypothetical protein DAMA08_013920 [Martiniozyma asiatica (nom. inval.)]|nr:hypothetical protein DAMA08_013920 [Martiniozyma asiatica]